MQSNNENELKLIRHQLASIDFSDIEILLNEKLSDGELNDRAHDTELFCRQWFDAVIKLLIQKQLEFIAKEAKDDYILAFGRGTINGLYLIEEWLREQKTLSLARFNKNKGELEGEI